MLLMALKALSPVLLLSFPTFRLLLLLLLVAGLYLNGLGGPLVFDDGPAISGNGHLTIDSGELDEWRTAALSSDSGPLHRPVAMWSFTANIVAAGGVAAVPLKSINLSIHLACGVLVYLLALGVLGSVWRSPKIKEVECGALFAAALWMLAPLHVSTVLYAVQRMAQLATFFALGALVLFTWYRVRWARDGALSSEVCAAALWVALLTVLAVLSKENGALVLWLIPVVEVTVFRGKWEGRQEPLVHVLGWIALISPLALFLIALALSPDTFLSGYAHREFTACERVLTQLRLLWQYLAWIFYPNINGMGFQHDDIALSRSWLEPISTLWSGISWLVALTLALSLRRRLPLLLFALLFFLVGHFMESGLWPLEMVYEHRNYLPSVAVYIFLSAGLIALIRLLPAVKPALMVFGLLSVCSTLLFLRVYTWSDAVRLAAVNVNNHPDSSRSHFFLAESLLKVYKKAGSSGVTRKSVELYPVRARNEFELMYQRNPEDIAAIVLLYTMDQSYFPELQQYRDWFSELEQVVHTKSLQASDYNALDSLLDCFEEAVCTEPPGRLVSVFDTLQARYPDSGRLVAMRYRLMKIVGTPAEQRLAFLNDAAVERPGSSRIYRHHLAELAQQRDIGGLYKAVKNWMANDPMRRQLSAIREMFEKPVVSDQGAATQ